MLRLYCVLNFTNQFDFFPLFQSMVCNYPETKGNRSQMDWKFSNWNTFEKQHALKWTGNILVKWTQIALSFEKVKIYKALKPPYAKFSCLMNSALSEMSAPTFYTNSQPNKHTNFIYVKFLEVVISWTKLSFLLVISKSVSCFHIKYCSYCLYTGPVKIKQVQIFRMIYNCMV